MTTNQKPETGEITKTQIDTLAAEFAQQFVRKDNKFFDVDYLDSGFRSSAIDCKHLQD